MIIGMPSSCRNCLARLPLIRTACPAAAIIATFIRLRFGLIGYAGQFRSRANLAERSPRSIGGLFTVASGFDVFFPNSAEDPFPGSGLQHTGYRNIGVP